MTLFHRAARAAAACPVALCAALSGCASVEYRSNPDTPVIVVRPAESAEEAITPPPLADETVTTAVSETEKPAKALNLSIEGAIVLALQNNGDLAVAEVNPAIQQTFVSDQRSVFDPVLAANYTMTEDSFTRDLLVLAPVPIPNFLAQTVTTVNLWQAVQTELKTRTQDYSANVTEYLPTGTNISVTVGNTDTRTRNKSTNPDLVYGTDTDGEVSDLNVTVTQSLLRGFGLGVNLASLRQAKLDTLASDYELRGVAEDLIAQVEQTYWNCSLAQRQIAIFEESLNVAQAQALEVDVRISIGGLAESERAAADAEVALRRSSLIDARSNYETLRLQLLRLINPTEESLRPVELNLTSDPITPEIALSDVEASIALAERMRPEVNQAKLQIQRNELDVVRTRNGLLPQLDVFLGISTALTRTNYTEAYLLNTQDLRDDRYTTQVGVDFSYPIGNRSARSQHSRAKLGRNQSELALKNLEQLVELDLRSAYVEVRRSQEQIAATAATRRLQEQTLAAEQEKFRLGRSTVLLVSQAQRDLLTAQIDEVQATAAYLNAIVNLYRLEGSLLERRGVAAPGRDPVPAEDGLDLYKQRGEYVSELVMTNDNGDVAP